MTRRIVITEPSHRSPRDDWRRPRSVSNVLRALGCNGFIDADAPVGVAFVRVCGLMAIRVTIAHGQATLHTGLRQDGQPVKWRPYRDRIGSEPWQVAREALELLATLDVDTPVRWG